MRKSAVSCPKRLGRPGALLRSLRGAAVGPRHLRCRLTSNPPPPDKMLHRNPLEDIANIRAIHTIIRDGRIVDRDSLPYERIFSTPRKGHAW